MTKKSRRKVQPKSPEQVMAEAQERRARRADVDALASQPDVRVKADEQHRIQYAKRLDVFALLFERNAITAPQLEAVRKLEADFAAMLGCDLSTGHREGDRTSTDGAPGQHVSQRMIEASRCVHATLDRIGPVSAKLLEALLEPQFRGAAITRWRDTVERITGEKNDRAQLALVRGATENLAQVYGITMPGNFIGDMNRRAVA